MARIRTHASPINLFGVGFVCVLVVRVLGHRCASNACTAGFKRVCSIQIKRNKTKRFILFYFPAAGHSLRRLHAMHDAPGLSYSYRSNCNSCEVIVMCPHPQFVLPRRRLHPPLDASRPEMICTRKVTSDVSYVTYVTSATYFS